MTFPVGYHSLHPDARINFQMNRWLGWVGELDMRDDMLDDNYRGVPANRTKA